MNLHLTQSAPSRYAFFDVDGTILRLRSMLTFQKFYYHHRVRFAPLGALNAWRSRLWWSYNILTQRDRHVVNRKYYESFRGRRQAEVREFARRWYEHEKGSRAQLFISDTIKAIEKHRENGVEIVLVSGSFVEILEPLASELGARHCLATILEVQDGRYTGRILPPQMIGDGKARAIRTFLADMQAPATECFAYGDHHTDIPMLETVGRPVAIGGDARLTEHALSRGWEILNSA